MTRVASRTTGSEVLDAFKPCPALAPYVQDIWAYELPRAARGGEPARLGLLPDGCPTIVFLYGAPLRASYGQAVFETRSAVCGFHARPVHLRCDGDVGGLTIRLTPVGLAAFVRGSVEPFAERRVECRDVFDARAIEALEDELAALPTSVARVRRVEGFLLGLLRPAATDPLVAGAITRLLATTADGTATIGALARQLDVSERTLERRFRRAIGAAPKPFSTVVRVQRALQHRARGAAWAELAVDAGYYDQAHLIRDARRVLGAPPEAVVQTEDTPLARDFRALSRTARLSATIFR